MDGGTPIPDLLEGTPDRSSRTERASDGPKPATSFRLTSAGRATLIMSVLALVAGWLMGLTEAYALGVAAAAALLVSAIRALIFHPRLSIERTVSPQRISAGGTFRSTITVRNSTRRRSPAVVVDEVHMGRPAGSFAVPSLRRSDSVDLQLPVPTTRRGTTVVGPTTFTLIDPFRLVERTTDVDRTDDLVVWPQTWPITAPLDRSHGEGGMVRSTSPNHLAHSEEFSSLGEYVQGDDPRHIHWPSSARTGQLVVKRFDTQEPRRTHVVLERFADNPGSFDVAVSLCASTVIDLLGRGEIVSFTTASVDHAMGRDHSDVFDVVDRWQLEPVMDHLALVQPQLRIPGDAEGSGHRRLEHRISAIVAALTGDRHDTVERLVVIGPPSNVPRSSESPTATLRGRIVGSPTVRWVGVPAVASMPSMDRDAAQDLVDDGVSPPSAPTYGPLGESLMGFDR